MRLLRILAAAALLFILPFFFFDLDNFNSYVPVELYALGHIGFFGLLGLLLMDLPPLRGQSLRRRVLLVMALILLLGTAIELIQPLFGRSAGLKDIWQNLVGAFMGVSLRAPAGLKRRILMASAALLLTYELYGPVTSLWDRAVAYSQFPVLSDFSTRFEHRRWSAGTVDNTIKLDAQNTLRLDLTPGRYAGTTLQRSFGNWTHYQVLQLSIYNPDTLALPLTVSIRDHDHFRRGGDYHDRFNRTFTLTQGWNTLEIPITTIRNAPRQRTLDLANLSEVTLFTTNLQAPRTLYLAHVQLLP